MLRSVIAFYLIVLIFGLLGCASLSRDECLNADWYMIGIEDGAQGKLVNTLAQHRKACAKVNITPNLNRYEKGHMEGVRRYCTFPQGLQLGESGQAYNGVCPSNIAGEFIKGYEAGNSRFVAREEVNRLQQEIKKLSDEIAVLEEKVQLSENVIVSSNSSVTERRQELEAMELHRSEINHLNEVQRNLARDLRRAEKKYQRLMNKKYY